MKNKNEINFDELDKRLREIKKYVDNNLHEGFVTEMYSPIDDNDIKEGERVFYTRRNAMYIDTVREYLEDVEEPYKTLILAPLLYEASVHTNTSGVFKGFYKSTKTGIGQFGGDGRNALSRILSNIEIKMPVFSDFSCDVEIFKEDANQFAKNISNVDLAYIDPPYNEHPYGSNYFMLNIITNYKKPSDISKVSGIPTDWNKSKYNKNKFAKETLYDLCENINAKYLLISFNSEGFITKEEMIEMLGSIGKVKIFDKEYNTFRGSRNLNNRDIHVKEYIYLVAK